jgi:iron-sulfur cluster insertion protein
MQASATLTPAAARRVEAIAQRQGKLPPALRLWVEGGGCSGFQYRFALAETVEPGDLVSETDGVRLVIDPDSQPFVAGAEVDFVETLGGAAFQVRNPNAAAGCGCGASFAV